MRPTMSHEEIGEFMEQLQHVDIQHRIYVMLAIKMLYAIDRLTEEVSRLGAKL